MKIVLVGASGFLGRALLSRLGEAGHQCTVFARNPDACNDLRLIRGVRLVGGNILDAGSLKPEFAGADLAVSMAGILNEKGRNGAGFRRVHVGSVEAVTEAAQAAGVPRIWHVSALNAGKGESHYLKTKGEAEARLRDSGIATGIFQPSVIFGPGDSFFNRFADLLALAPLMPLACPEARMQPVYVGDVVDAMTWALEAAPEGGTWQLGGPRVYTLRELVEFTGMVSGHRRRIIGLPDLLSRLQAGVMDFVPGKPFSTDNFRSLQTDNVAERNALPGMGIRPMSIEAVVPRYLGHSLKQNRLDHYRRSARDD